MYVADGLGMLQHDGLAGSDGSGLGMAEHRLAAGEREFVDEFYLLVLFGVVLHLGLDEDAVAGGIVPDVDAEGLDAHVVGLDEADRAEDAEGLAALGESPLAAAPAAHPRAGGLHGGMVDGHLEPVFAILQMVGDVERPDGAPHEFLRIAVAVECDGGKGAHALELEEVALAVVLVGGEHLIIFGLAVQIAVAQLAVAVIVVEVVGQVDGVLSV